MHLTVAARFLISSGRGENGRGGGGGDQVHNVSVNITALVP